MGRIGIDQNGSKRESGAHPRQGGICREEVFGGLETGDGEDYKGMDYEPVQYSRIPPFYCSQHLSCDIESSRRRPSGLPAIRSGHGLGAVKI